MTTNKATPGPSNRVQALKKGFQVIDALKESGRAGVSELAKTLEIPTSTAHVHLKTLEDTGYVLQRDGKYELSLRFLETGGHLLQQIKVYQIARREMKELANRTHETVGLGIAENDRRVLLWQVEGENAVNDNICIGEHTRMHWTSLGKALLANFSDDRIESVIDSNGLPKSTEHTITDREELLEELRSIRQQGYSMEDEERKEGIRSVSVPIVDSTGTVIAALGITAPKSRYSPAKCEQYIQLLQDKANIISIKYNYW